MPMLVCIDVFTLDNGYVITYYIPGVSDKANQENMLST